MLLNHFKRINDIAVSCEYRSAQHNNNRQIENGKKNSIYNLFSIKTLDWLASKHKNTTKNQNIQPKSTLIFKKRLSE